MFRIPNRCYLTINYYYFYFLSYPCYPDHRMLSAAATWTGKMVGMMLARLPAVHDAMAIFGQAE